MRNRVAGDVPQECPDASRHWDIDGPVGRPASGAVPAARRSGGRSRVQSLGRQAWSDGAAHLPGRTSRHSCRRRCLPGHVPHFGAKGWVDPKARFGRELVIRGRASRRGEGEGSRKRRATCESEWVGMAEAEPSSTDCPSDFIPEVHEEVDRLPEQYRAPIVLCYLEGLTSEEAANQLHLPASTVRVRLMRARTRLRDRLIRRGLGPAVLARIAAGRGEAAIPDPLVDETIKSAVRIAVGRTPGLSVPVAALVEGVIRAMLFANLKIAAALMAALMLASLWLISSLAGPAQLEQDPVVAKDPAAADIPKPKGDGPEVTVVAVKRSRWERTTTEIGTVIAAQSVDLYARISGYLSNLRVDSGSSVKRHDVVAEIAEDELRIAIEKASAEVDRAKARVRKAEAAMQVARATKGTERAKVEAASTALDESEAQVRYRKKQLDRFGELAKKGDIEQRVVDETTDLYASTLAGSKTARSQLEVARAAELGIQAKIEAAQADVHEAVTDLRIAEAGVKSARSSQGTRGSSLPSTGS